MSRKRGQVAFFVANVKAIYLALMEDWATVNCFLEHQLMKPLLSIKIKLNIDFRLSLFST